LKPVRLRPAAEEDLVEATRHYNSEAGRRVAERFFDDALAALDTLKQQPLTGSPRLGQMCDVPGLRSWRLKDFPMQWFYFDTPRHLDVVRLLGDRQDILAILESDRQDR
jgi:toxin ParE1/3/4